MHKTIMDLKQLRKDIDTIDNQVVSLIKKRMSIAKKVGEYKKKNNLPVYSKKREDEILSKLKRKAKKDYILFEQVYKKIFSHSRRLQRK